ncbi:Formate/nitrite transporter FocA, FNT family [Micromonospora nigra]|uniref:Formate/nitrite transporter FocA, FNT family n=1 Tax=Micromonospora nigra TaxID=145857 RepID=A0A1C6RBB3_9ACTN|nr:formate/nitrite transporter family protein [Micromonospora nigra]SCL14286.1 Formate/nitrite transporter FocA, FNT family [Micromonospora nigra]
MAQAPRPEDVYASARTEGERRLSMSALEQASTGFIAGVTIVFGIVALGMVRELVAPDFADGVGQLVGALAFGIGLVFVVVGRTELFTENFFDPVAAALHRRRPAAIWQLVRLWTLVLVLNFVGGAVMAAVFTVEGTLPAGAHHTLALMAEEIAAKEGLATVTRGVAAGTLLTLLSYLLHAVGSAGSRIALAYVVGFFLALGPFDHVVVSGLHLLSGIWLGADVSYADLGLNVVLSGTGNLLGGLLLMTLTHAVQVRGTR